MKESAVADDAEAAAYADLYCAAPGALRELLGLQVRREAGATLLVAGRLPVPMFNRVIGLGVHEVATAAALQGICEVYRRAGAKNWWLHWSPDAQPPGFESLLQGRGFGLAARRSWAKMLRGPEPPEDSPTPLSIGEAADGDALPVARAIATAFDMPPFMADWLAALRGRPRWRVYAVKEGDAVVGGGCLFVQGDIAWLGMGSLLASHRGRGGHRALMASRIADAIAAGAVRIVTETGEPVAGEPNSSLENMRRSGFRQVASRLNYAAPAACAEIH